MNKITVKTSETTFEDVSSLGVNGAILQVGDVMLSCPFCGGEPKKKFIGNSHTKTRKIEVACTKCFTKQVTGTVRFGFDKCEEWANEKWNSRIDDYNDLWKLMDEINTIMWESYMIEGKEFDRTEGLKIMERLEQWAERH